jgi:membrane associated rhomboid family serine protease
MEEKRKFVHSLIFPLLFLVVIWLVKFFEISMEMDFVQGGILPRNPKGLIGIFTSPLIHADWKHLFDNSFPAFLLCLALFYFYRGISYQIFFLIYFIGNILVWIVGREAYHIGASGIIYGLAAFLFLSGVIRKIKNLMAISLIVVFMYGSLVWGLLPYDYKVSWEGHLMGAITGVLLAIFYRDKGPEPYKPSWELEDEEGDEEDEEEKGREGEEENVEERRGLTQ